MINIFNLFLLLLAIWSGSVYALQGFNYEYLFIGSAVSLVISVFCFNLRLINKKSELLYLSWGFYKYFINLYIRNIGKQIILQIKMALIPSIIDSKTIKVHLKFDEEKKNSLLFESTVDFMAGYSVIELTSDYIIVGAINSDYASRFSGKSIFKKLKNINDDSLV